jgi:hydrogenase maturation factor
VTAVCLGTVGVITEVHDEDGLPMALVSTDQGTVSACLLTCPEASVGRTVLVHCGYALQILDAEENKEQP